MKIGELAKIVDSNVETIRYYERIGILPNPKRTPSGYRNYGNDAVSQMKFIQFCQQLGFTLNEISQLVKLKDQQLDSIDTALQGKVANLDQRLNELAQFKDQLLSLTQTQELNLETA